MTGSAESAVSVNAATGGRVPDFFIVGHHKCGTTALYETLRRQPQVYMPDVKEPSFFVPELEARYRKRKSANHPDTLDGYLALFRAARPEQRVGESSPSYLWSHTAARRIAEVQPAARIIAILREPASFLHSLHLQWVRSHVETEKDLRRAIALEQRRREGQSLPRYSTRPQWLLYSEHVRYVEQLRRFHAVFPREQVLVLIYEEYRADNEGTVRQVLRFLEVDDTAPIEVIEANPTVRVRSPRLYALVRSLYLGQEPLARALKTGIKALTPQQLRHQAIAMQRRAQRGRPRPPDERLMLELRHRYKDEVLALSEYLDRDLVTLWGYEGIV
jgi:Sulfotransferase domain